MTRGGPLFTISSRVSDTPPPAVEERRRHVGPRSARPWHCCIEVGSGTEIMDDDIMMSNNERVVVGVCVHERSRRIFDSAVLFVDVVVDDSDENDDALSDERWAPTPQKAAAARR